MAGTGGVYESVSILSTSDDEAYGSDGELKFWASDSCLAVADAERRLLVGRRTSNGVIAEGRWSIAEPGRELARDWIFDELGPAPLAFEINSGPMGITLLSFRPLAGKLASSN